MKFTVKSSRLTYKTLFGYSLVVIILLLVAVPVFATSSSGSGLLDFSFRSEAGNTPQTARILTKGVNLNHLNPGEEDWYTYSRSVFESSDFSWLSLVMRYESEARLDLAQVNFEVLTQNQDDTWFQEPDPAQELLGTGLRSPLSASQSVIESFWTGHVAQQQLYYVRVFNNSPFGLDYVLEAKEEQPVVSGATPASLNSALGSSETLSARQLAWTLTAQAVENMPAKKAAAWMEQAQSVGWLVTAGTPAVEIPSPGKADPKTLWTLTAQAIEGQEADQAARWLLEADALGWLAIPLNTLKDPYPVVTEGSTGGGGGGGAEPPAEPVPPKELYTPINIYPNNPLPFDLEQVNSGRLAPYGEHWYSLSRDDLDQTLIEDMEMTMFFTPQTGFMSNRINFEIIPAGQYHIWQRGDADYMEHLGAGMWISRDEDPHTGERLWSGALVDGDRYLVKVKNGTSEVVDYYLFPGDIENAELGNPLLHQADSLAGRIPYAAAPPTRPGPPPEPGDGPPEAIPLEVGLVSGTLEGGQEKWYRFFYHGSDDESELERTFTIYLTNTPADGVRARHADFAIYPAGQLHIWTRGTTAELEPLGTSAPSPYKTDDVRALQVLWEGQLMAGQLYYIKVYNHDLGPLNYELEVKGGP